MKRSLVMLFDAEKGDFISEELYDLPPKKALINAIEQYKGNYNTWEYPKEIDGIYKSKMVKDRLMYDITEDLIMVSQKA